MGLALENYGSFLFVMLLLPSLCFCQDTYVSSRATYYGSPDCLGTPTGACGLGDYGRTINGGAVSGVSRLYKNGTGCGACYQVRCKAPQHCTEDGVKLVVTDYGEGDHTDFILSLRAYSNLALPNMAAGLFEAGVVDIEYRRIPCQYPGYNLVFKVHEHSRFPEYLALVPLYQAGINEITAVELWQFPRFFERQTRLGNQILPTIFRTMFYSRTAHTKEIRWQKHCHMPYLFFQISVVVQQLGDLEIEDNMDHTINLITALLSIWLSSFLTWISNYIRPKEV